MKPLCSKNQLFWVGQMLEADGLWTALSICRRQSVPSPHHISRMGPFPLNDSMWQCESSEDGKLDGEGCEE